MNKTIPAGPTDWEAEARAALEAELERQLAERRAAQARSAQQQEFRAAEAAWMAEHIPLEADRIEADWMAKKVAERRGRAERVAHERLMRRRRAMHAANGTGPFSIEGLADVGRVSPKHYWEGIPPRPVPSHVDQEYWPATVRDRWQLRPDGIYRTFPRRIKSIPPGVTGEVTLHPLANNTIVEWDLTGYHVASPVWPVARGNATAPRRYVALVRKTWKTIEVPLLDARGGVVDLVEALKAAGVTVNPEPFIQKRHGAVDSGEVTPVPFHARHLLVQFLDEASTDVP